MFGDGVAGDSQATYKRGYGGTVGIAVHESHAATGRLHTCTCRR